MNGSTTKRVLAEEWFAVILSFIYYFCVLAAYYVMRPLRDQLAAKVGSGQLPLFFATTLVVMIILTPLFSWIVSRWPRAIVMPFVYMFFILCQLIFMPFFNNPELLSPKSLGLLFFVWVSVFNLFVVSVFWSFMTDIWSDMQARRLFPIIALGGTLGAITGPIITRNLVEEIGLASLLNISIVFLFAAIFCVVVLGYWAHKYSVHHKEADSESALGGGMLDGLKQIFSNPFIAWMSLLMFMSDAIGTIAYALVTDYSGVMFHNNAIAQTRFAANMDLASNVIQVIFQLSITRWVLVKYGAGSAFAMCAAIVVTACLGMAAVPDATVPILWGMPYVALVLILTRALAHGVIQPARETLYTLVPRDLRYKGKNAVDTVVWRAGDVMSLLAVNAFRSLGVTVAGFGVLWAALAAASGVIGWRLARQVERGEFEEAD